MLPFLYTPNMLPAHQQCAAARGPSQLGAPRQPHSQRLRRASSPDPDWSIPTVEQLVGNTPLVRLQNLPGVVSSNLILAKLEEHNPAGSSKDRPALNMLREDERRGRIKPGDTIIEATSGNTGIALAMAAAIRGDARRSGGAVGVLGASGAVGTQRVQAAGPLGLQMLLTSLPSSHPQEEAWAAGQCSSSCCCCCLLRSRTDGKQASRAPLPPPQQM